MRAARRIRTGLLAGLALLAYWLMAVSVSPRLGVTADEVVHLTGGYTYWKFNDYRMHPENGTLPMRLAALPWLGPGVHHPPLTDPDWLNSKVNLYGGKLFFASGNDLDALLWRSRMVMALAGVFTAWLTWRWARRLFGPAAGWVALALAVCCPVMLAHGGLATSDMTMTACVLGTLTLGWQLLHRLTWGRLLGTTLACGLAFLSKMSGVLIVPLLGALLVLRWWRGTPLPVALGGPVRLLRRRGQIIAATLGAAAFAAAGSIVILWAGYGFRYEGFNRAVSGANDYYVSWDAILDKAPLPWPQLSSTDRLLPPQRLPHETDMTHLIGWMRDHRLLPEAYLWGFAHTYKFSQYRPAYFLGEYRTTGWKTFFPVAFLLKTTPAALLLIVAGTATLLWAARRRTGPRIRPWTYRAAPLLLFFAVYWVMAINMHLNIGHRHILPTYPVFYILASAVAVWVTGRTRLLALFALGVVLAMHAADSWLARPSYLSYFTPLAGGTTGGYHYLVDSSYDWGQGLPELRRWLAGRKAAGDRTPVYLTYFGADSPRARGLDVVRFGDDAYDTGARVYPASVRGGWFVVSATHYQRTYLPTRGPWTEQTEALYRELTGRLQAAGRASAPRPPAEEARVLQDASDYEMLQFGRLSHYLHRREPREVVGGSLLVFRLTDAEVAEALYGPPPFSSRSP
jgi:hypothetical protein